jgi:hypothetical protein
VELLALEVLAAAAQVLRPPLVEPFRQRLQELQTLVAAAAEAVAQAAAQARAALVGLAWSSCPCRPYIIPAARPARQQ